MLDVEVLIRYVGHNSPDWSVQYITPAVRVEKRVRMDNITVIEGCSMPRISGVKRGDMRYAENARALADLAHERNRVHQRNPIFLKPMPDLRDRGIIKFPQSIGLCFDRQRQIDYGDSQRR